MSVLDQVDHLVYATRDLEATCADLERRLAVRPTPGGRHPGRGTRNALIGLGPRAYLEVIGPDPSQPTPPVSRWFAIDALDQPRLVTWAARATDLPTVIARAAERGVVLGPPASGRRDRADGVALHWAYTDPGVVIADGIVPFFIDWGDGPHPAETAADGVALARFEAEHPEVGRVQETLEALGLALPVRRGPRAALVATLRAGAREIELR